MLPLERFSYEELQKLYNDYFSLSYLNTDIGSKFAVISLIGHLTHKVKSKTPNATCYQVIMKILGGESHTHNPDFINGLSIICEDFMKHTDKFLTFDLKSDKEIIAKIREILDTYIPF